MSTNILWLNNKIILFQKKRTQGFLVVSLIIYLNQFVELGTTWKTRGCSPLGSSEARSLPLSIRHSSISVILIWQILVSVNATVKTASAVNPMTVRRETWLTIPWLTIPWNLYTLLLKEILLSPCLSCTHCHDGRSAYPDVDAWTVQFWIKTLSVYLCTEDTVDDGLFGSCAVT